MEGFDRRAYRTPSGAVLMSGMKLIDETGLFHGDRLRRCSNKAQLHWPRLFMIADGFGRLEINYALILGRAYPTFNPLPSEPDIESLIREYVENYLLFPYWDGGELWGQWDTRPEFLPRYKTAFDRRSPIPPEPAFTEWKNTYRQQKKGFPKLFTPACMPLPLPLPMPMQKNTDLDCPPANRKQRDSQAGACVASPIKEYPELRQTLSRYMGKQPSHRTVVDILQAAGGASEHEVIECLAYLWNERGLRPGTKNGPETWSWFKTVLLDHFARRREREEVANPCGYADWEERNESRAEREQFERMTNAIELPDA